MVGALGGELSSAELGGELAVFGPDPFERGTIGSLLPP